MTDEARRLLRAVVRGDEPPDALCAIGVRIDGAAGTMRAEIPPSPTFEFSLADLARGLVVGWARGRELQRWASAVLMLTEIQFTGIDSLEGQLLLDALWSAAAAEPLDEDVLAVATRLAAQHRSAFASLGGLPL